MDSSLKGLTDEKRHLVKEARDIIELAERESRDLTQEEQNYWDECNTQIDAIDKRAQRLERVDALEGGLRRSRGTQVGGKDAVAAGGAATAVAAAERAAPDPAKEKRDAFNKFLRNGYAVLN